MAIALATPDIDGLREVVDTLTEWQHDEAPFQLHPGDLGWFWRFGADAVAAAVRTWRRHGRIVAIGLLDGPTLLRLTTAPEVPRNHELAERIVEDVIPPERGVLPAGKVSVEAPTGALVHDLLGQRGWSTDEPWTPLCRDLTAPVATPDVRIEVVGSERAQVWVDVQRAAFGAPPVPDTRWHAMAAGLPYASARCLLAYGDQSRVLGTESTGGSGFADSTSGAVAAVAVWSAGPGKPGLLEPMGVHPDHRGRGYGTAITVAAAAVLREMGSSSATVCTPTANAGAVATYAAAGFQERPERRDSQRQR